MSRRNSSRPPGQKTGNISSGNELGPDPQPKQSIKRTVIDKAALRKGQTEYELGFAEEAVQIEEWETQIATAKTCILRLSNAQLDSKPLHNKVGRMTKAIHLFREARASEEKVRLARYADVSSLTARRKGELTRAITSRQTYKHGKLRGAEIILQSLLKTLQASEITLSAGTVGAVFGCKPSKEEYDPSALKPAGPTGGAQGQGYLTSSASSRSHDAATEISQSNHVPNVPNPNDGQGRPSGVTLDVGIAWRESQCCIHG